MKNEYEFTDCGNCCRIYFLDGSFFTIDADDFPAVSKYTWALGKRGYPVAHTSRRSEKGHKTFSLHRFLMDPEEGYDVDHVSGDKLDNRRENLRVCSHQENMFNQKLRCTNTSTTTSVTKSESEWTASAIMAALLPKMPAVNLQMSSTTFTMLPISVTLYISLVRSI